MWEYDQYGILATRETTEHDRNKYISISVDSRV